MALPTVAQARLLSEELGGMLRSCKPRSVAIIGSAGGNGLDQIDSGVTSRVVAVDIDPAYTTELERRFAKRLPGLEVYVADIENTRLRIPSVEFVYAALVLEYVDLNTGLAWLKSICAPGATMTTVTQRASAVIASVTPSPFASLQTLAPAMRLVSSIALEASAERLGFSLQSIREVRSLPGKNFSLHIFESMR